MYCPIVTIFPSLRRVMPSDGLLVICCKPSIDVKFGKVVKIRDGCFEGFSFYR